jgi:hypothetical protein
MAWSLTPRKRMPPPGRSCSTNFCAPVPKQAAATSGRLTPSATTGALSTIGIEMCANALHFDPALPDNLHHIKVQLRYRRQVLDIEVDHDALRIGSRSFTSTPIEVAYRGHYRDLAPGEVCQFRLLKPEDRDRDENRIMKAAKEAKQ